MPDSDLAISIRDIRKTYRVAASASPAGGVWNRLRNRARHFTALDGICFDVCQGEVIGLIGRNGAGKSTLLKILSRVVEPSGGEIDLYGRVGSLLEVGTGFHPELTGRENVFLNGAILGMSKRDIRAAFDAIVNFAEVAPFIDTPVKRYSSGMYVRLAFAVAAHLHPEILVVDEVLSVGDLNFQQKCLAHLGRLRKAGTTIFLVSHNMAAIQTCCTRGVVLEAGRVVADGPVLSAIETYRELLRDEPASAAGSSAGDVDIVKLELLDASGRALRVFTFGQAMRVRIHVESRRRVDRPLINFGIRRGDGVSITNFNNWYDGFAIDFIDGPCVLEGWLPPMRLVPGFYETHAQVWPWGGGHLPTDLASAAPLAARTFGDFKIEGPALNSHDGVYQTPALRWRFERAGQAIEHAEMTDQTLFEAFRS